MNRQTTKHPLPRRVVPSVAMTFLLVIAGLSLFPKYAISAAVIAPPAHNCGTTGVAGSSGLSSTCTYNTVGPDTFTAPGGSAVLATFDVLGAQGGGPPAFFGVQAGPQAGVGGGLGGEAMGTLRLAPGQPLQINVGAAGTEASTSACSAGGCVGGGGSGGGFGLGGVALGGDGGGSSDVRVSPYFLFDRLIVAGGGGGNGASSTKAGRLPALGGHGGGGGGNGATDVRVIGIQGECAGCTGGAGGYVGQGGGGGYGGANPGGNGGGGGSIGGGGGGYAASSDAGGGGGGGGGYVGGGGGGGGPDANSHGGGPGGGGGGGGGGGYVSASASGAVLTSGVQNGNGKVTVTFAPAPPGPLVQRPPVSPAPPLRVPCRTCGGGPASYTLAASGTLSGGAQVKTTVKNPLNLGLVVTDADTTLASFVGLVRLGHVDPGSRTLPWDLRIGGQFLTTGRYVVALEIFGPDGQPSGRAFPAPALLTVSPEGQTAVAMTSPAPTAATSETNWTIMVIGVIAALAMGTLVGLIVGRRRRSEPS